MEQEALGPTTSTKTKNKTKQRNAVSRWRGTVKAVWGNVESGSGGELMMNQPRSGFTPQLLRDQQKIERGW